MLRGCERREANGGFSGQVPGRGGAEKTARGGAELGVSMYDMQPVLWPSQTSGEVIDSAVVSRLVRRQAPEKSSSEPETK